MDKYFLQSKKRKNPPTQVSVTPNKPNTGASDKQHPYLCKSCGHTFKRLSAYYGMRHAESSHHKDDPLYNWKVEIVSSDSPLAKKPKYRQESIIASAVPAAEVIPSETSETLAPSAELVSDSAPELQTFVSNAESEEEIDDPSCIDEPPAVAQAEESSSNVNLQEQVFRLNQKVDLLIKQAAAADKKVKTLVYL